MISVLVILLARVPLEPGSIVGIVFPPPVCEVAGGLPAPSCVRIAQRLSFCVGVNLAPNKLRELVGGHGFRSSRTRMAAEVGELLRFPTPGASESRNAAFV